MQGVPGGAKKYSTCSNWSGIRRDLDELLNRISLLVYAINKQAEATETHNDLMRELLRSNQVILQTLAEMEAETADEEEYSRIPAAL